MREAPDREARVAIHLAMAIINLDKFDIVLQKATELGVRSIIPLVTDRVEIRAERYRGKAERWRKIVFEAVKQSGRSVIPIVEEPQPFDEIVKRDGAKIVFDADAEPAPQQLSNARRSSSAPRAAGRNANCNLPASTAARSNASASAGFAPKPPPSSPPRSSLRALATFDRLTRSICTGGVFCRPTASPSPTTVRARSYEVPINEETIRATDLRKIKVNDDDFGMMTYDPAFMNTAACRSAITFIDGDKGILEYRGYPIEQLAEQSTYLETAWLLLNGELPTKDELEAWTHTITYHTFINENLKGVLDSFRYNAHPMGMLIAMISALGTFYPEAKNIFDEDVRKRQIERLIAKMITIAGFGYRHMVGMPYVYPDNELSYPANFLNMMYRTTELKLRAGAGARARARRALHPARRSRAELLDEHDARRRQLARRSVLRRRRRLRRALRTAARRRERAGHPHAHARSARSRTSPPSSRR